jgi:putative peptidoglycan binding protein
VPKAIALDGDRPRRRRGGSVAVEETTERSLVMRILLYSPKDTVAGAIAFAAVSAIVANAIFMQAGRHPSPMFGGSVAVPIAAPAPASPLPRPRPIEAAGKPPEAKPPEAKLPEAKLPESKSLETKSLETKSLETKSVDIRPVEAKPFEAKSADPPAHPVKASGASSVASTNVLRPPAPIPPSSRNDPVGDLIPTSHRVATVQRALTEYGYGQLKPTGTVGSDTQAAIQKFERDRKMPVTGQMSERLVRELTAMTGRPID